MKGFVLPVKRIPSIRAKWGRGLFWAKGRRAQTLELLLNCVSQGAGSSQRLKVLMHQMNSLFIHVFIYLVVGKHQASCLGNKIMTTSWTFPACVPPSVHRIALPSKAG